MTRSNTLAWTGAALLVALAYLFGLGGNHMLSLGDELVYSNIARLTADSGHWLPLVSAFDHMRNTKPPLLFWQAMVAGGWGEHWTLFRLRLPSIFYTWATTVVIGLLTFRIAPLPDQRTDRNTAIKVGAIAALAYLGFLSTYRYGRPYLTSAPETFWLCGVFLALAWSPEKLLASRWKFPLAAGIAIGIGCLYKSFAMAVPVAFGLALCYQVVGAKRPVWASNRPGIAIDALKVIAVGLLAVAIFALWFAVDPQPEAVWREFVVGENAGKFKSSPGYFHVAFSGTSGFTTILFGYFSNAGFLLPVAIGCVWTAWRTHRRGERVSSSEKVLWLWLLALALVFLLPNQRTARYLIPAMPAAAVLLGLYWNRIARGWFVATLLACAIGALCMVLIAYGAIGATQTPWLYSPLFWLFMAVLIGACVAGMFAARLTRPVATVAAFAVLLALSWVTSPFNGEIGNFKPASVQLLKGQPVSVLNLFNGHFERYAFIIPGAQLVPTEPKDFSDIDALLKRRRYALVQSDAGAPRCTACRVIDERFELRSRPDENKGGTFGAFKSPQTYWFTKEYLLERAAP